jgi:hypothetical protein
MNYMLLSNSILVVILAIFVTLRFYAVFRLKRVFDKVSVSRQALHCANLLLMDFYLLA